MTDDTARPRKRRCRFAPLDKSLLPSTAHSNNSGSAPLHATDKKSSSPVIAEGKTPTTTVENGVTHSNSSEPRRENAEAASSIAEKEDVCDGGDDDETPVTWSSCRSVDLYERLNFIDEGTYGRVYRAREISTGIIHALKKVKVTQERDGFPLSSLREISSLFTVSHPNIVKLKEVVVGTGSHNVYMVLEYAANSLQSNLSRMHRPYSASETKCIVQQLLFGVAHIHDSWIIHRDLKPANILVSTDGILKICDFGLARPTPDDDQRRSPGVTTLWYRAPEVLLADPSYTTAIDMWSVGCIVAELVLRKPLLQGTCELDQIRLICHLLGPPSEQCWSGFNKLPNASRIAFPAKKLGVRERLLEHGAFLSDAGIDLVQSMLCYDPRQRITAESALRHRYFTESPPPKDPALIQTFPDDRRG